MPPLGQIFTSSEITQLVAYLRDQGRAFARGEIAGPAALPATPIKTQLHPFRFESVAEDLDTPWGLAFLPGGKILFTERPGRLRLIENGQLNPQPVTGLPKVWLRQDGGLLDVMAHPDHATNGWLCLAYSEMGRARETSMTVVIRGRVRRRPDPSAWRRSRSEPVPWGCGRPSVTLTRPERRLSLRAGSASAALGNNILRVGKSS